MKRLIIAFAAAMLALSACSQKTVDIQNVPDATSEQIVRAEPPCWWVGMKTSLQLMVYGPSISEYEVSLVGLQGVKVADVHKAESPNYLFVDVAVAPSASAGTAYFVFSRGEEQFKLPYEFASRREGSAERESFSRKDLIYLIMPDRFANGDPSNDNTPSTTEKCDYDAFFGRHGGDIQGIIDHLDYIADLGVTAIWSTPMLEDNVDKESYHGYACTDYYNIDSRLGSNELYRQYVAEAHKRGIKIIMDVVTNHSGDRYWWMNDLPFASWIHSWPEYTHTNCSFSVDNDPYCAESVRQNMKEGWFDTAMVDMNLDNPYLLQFFKQWAAWWIEWADIDGFRVDTYPYNEKYPMAEWCASVLSEYPNFNIVGEIWSYNIPQVAYWQADNPNKDGFNSHLPSIMDFCLHSAICQGINTDVENWDNGMMKIYDSMSNDFYYQDPTNIMIFPGNHDTDRIGDVVGQDPAKMKIVYALMATLRGFPQIFAGDELMCVSRDRRQGHGGLRVEFPEDWASDPVKKDLHDYFSTLFQWRKGCRTAQEGGFLHYLTRDNTYAYFRHSEDAVVFVYINNNTEPHEIPWDSYSQISSGLTVGRNVITGEPVDVSQPLVASPRSALIVEF